MPFIGGFLHFFLVLSGSLYYSLLVEREWSPRQKRPERW